MPQGVASAPYADTTRRLVASEHSAVGSTASLFSRLGFTLAPLSAFTYASALRSRSPLRLSKTRFRKAEQSSISMVFRGQAGGRPDALRRSMLFTHTSRRNMLARAAGLSLFLLSADSSQAQQGPGNPFTGVFGQTSRVCVPGVTADRCRGAFWDNLLLSKPSSNPENATMSDEEFASSVARLKELRNAVYVLQPFDDPTANSDWTPNKVGADLAPLRAELRRLGLRVCASFGKGFAKSKRDRLYAVLRLMDDLDEVSMSPEEAKNPAEFSQTKRLLSKIIPLFDIFLDELKPDANAESTEPSGAAASTAPSVAGASAEPSGATSAASTASTVSSGEGATLNSTQMELNSTQLELNSTSPPNIVSL